MPKNILIVEDQEEVRELVKVTLSLGDYDIMEAGDGETALVLARSRQPELILMDVQLPGAVDGLAATRILKSEEATRRCRIIMLTATSQQTDIAAGYAAGADGYFTKPFSPLELIQRVEEELA